MQDGVQVSQFFVATYNIFALTRVVPKRILVDAVEVEDAWPGHHCLTGYVISEHSTSFEHMLTLRSRCFTFLYAFLIQSLVIVISSFVLRRLRPKQRIFFGALEVVFSWQRPRFLLGYVISEAFIALEGKTVARSRCVLTRAILDFLRQRYFFFF